MCHAVWHGECGKFVGRAEGHVVARIGQHLGDRLGAERAGIGKAGSPVANDADAHALALGRHEVFDLALIHANGGLAAATDIGLDLFARFGLGHNRVGKRLQFGNLVTHAAVPPMVIPVTRRVG